MIVTFLGTGTSQGVPVIGCQCEVCTSVDFRDKRLRTSVHIAIDNKSLIIDSGPDFRQQVLRERIHALDALIFTHEHKDHTAGLDDVRGYNYIQQKNIPIYGRKKVLEQIKKEFAYAFSEIKYPGIPLIDLHEIENTKFSIEGVDIIPIEVLHYKLPVFGYRIGDFSYITDANFISEEEKQKLKGSKVIVLNALQQTEHISHFKLSEALTLINELKPEQAFLTHMSHKMGLHRTIDKSLPPNIHLAYDGLKIEI